MRGLRSKELRSCLCLNYSNRTFTLIRKHEAKEIFIDEAEVLTKPTSELIQKWREYFDKTVDNNLKSITAKQIDSSNDNTSLRDAYYAYAYDANGVSPIVSFYYPFNDLSKYKTILQDLTTLALKLCIQVFSLNSLRGCII